MDACLVGPGPEEVILLLELDVLMSSYGEGLFALCTKRCLTGRVEGGDAVLSQPVMLSHTKACLRPMTVQNVRLVITVRSANVAHSAKRYSV